MAWELVQALFLFALVLALAWFSTRFVGLRMGAPGRGRLLRVLEHVPAGRDRSILLLEVGGKVYLVGATGEQINLLDAIDDPEVIRKIMEPLPEQSQNPLGELIPGSFKETLARFVPQPQPPTRLQAQQPAAPAQAEPAEEEIERMKQQIERLRRLQQE